MDYDGGEGARSSLSGRLDGRLEEELSSDGEERYVFCAVVIGCNTSMASMRHASLSLQYQFHVTRDWLLAKGSRD